MERKNIQTYSICIKTYTIFFQQFIFYTLKIHFSPIIKKNMTKKQKKKKHDIFNAQIRSVIHLDQMVHVKIRSRFLINIYRKPVVDRGGWAGI